MRKKLAEIKERRKRFAGIFKRFGLKRNFKGAMEKTVLIEKISEAGSPVVLSDHLWMNYTKSFDDAGFLAEGDRIEFDARVKPYEKGYVNKRDGLDERKLDYRLSHPTKVERIL
jgi:hypothetical protein